MAKDVWVSLSADDRVILRVALTSFVRENSEQTVEVAKLLNKLEPARPYPDITIGVYGGQVQWTLGNPFPVRIRDYDGDKCDLPDLDEGGDWCRQWLEPPDTTIAN